MPNMDYDFIGFTFGDKHSCRDLKIYRTSEGSRYNTNLTAPIKDTAVDVPGGDGQYLFDTKYAARQFSIPFAFNRLTEEEVATLRRTFSGKEVKELIFDELPYKAYSAKVSGTPVIKVIPFTETLTNGTVNRVYRGEGTVQFTCHYPFAHTPTWRWKSTDGVVFSQETIDGRVATNYTKDGNKAYPTSNEWENTTDLAKNTTEALTNHGNIPAPFLIELSYSTTSFTVAGNTITLKEPSPSTWYWDSRLGLVYRIDSNGKKIPLKYTGNACAAIPVGDSTAVKYQYWYY